MKKSYYEDRRYKYSLLVILFFGVSIRIIPYFKELSESPIFFYQPDNYYYLRRALTILKYFPFNPAYDLYFNYPNRLDYVSPYGYPYLLAALTNIVSMGKYNEHLLEIVSATVCAVAGGLVALPVYGMAVKLLNKPVALLAAFLSVITPMHYWYTVAIAGDLHAVEILLALTTFYLFTIFLTDYKKGVEIRKKGNFIPLIAYLTVLFLVWQGAVLYSSLLAVFLIFLSFSKKDYGCAICSYALILLISSLVIAILTFVNRPYEATLDYGRYSYFQAFFLFFTSLSLFLIAFAKERRHLMFLLTLAVFLSLSYILRAEIIKGLKFLFKQEKGFGSVLEMSSVFSINYWNGSFDDQFLIRNIFFIVTVAPIFSFLIIDRKDVKGLFYCYLVAVFAVLTFNQRRFGYIYYPLTSIFYAGIFLQLTRRKRQFFVVILLAALLWYSVDWIISTKRIVGSVVHKELRSAYSWLRKNTDPPSIDTENPYLMPSYTVFAPWDQGYFVVYMAKRPVFANNALLNSSSEGFIDSIKLGVTNSLSVFKSLLDKYNARYIVALKKFAGIKSLQFLGYPVFPVSQRIYAKLTLFNGRLDENNFLENFRLLYFVGDDRDENNEAKIFEYVKGATVSVRAADKTKIYIEAVSEGKLLHCQSKVTLNGETKFVLPYADKNGIYNNVYYVVTDGKRKQRFALSEKAVIHGKLFTIDMKKVTSEPLYFE